MIIHIMENNVLGQAIFPQTLSEYHTSLAKVLSADGTVVFLDTNVLVYPYRIFEEARKELTAWFEDLKRENRLWIPAWVANEYFYRVSVNKLNEFVPQVNFAKLSEQLKNHLRMARLVYGVNQKTKNGKNLYAMLDQAEDVVEGLVSELKPPQREVHKIHKLLETIFGDRIINSDIHALCCRAAEIAPLRISHRLPPSFKDVAKEENRYGDLIVWLELLKWSKQSTFDTLLLITNDEKIDWSYAPNKRRMYHVNGYKMEPNDNPQIRLTDPRLIREFKANSHFSHEFMVASIYHVVAALSIKEPSKFGALAQALQLIAAIDESDKNGQETMGANNESSREPTTESVENTVNGQPDSIHGDAVEQTEEGPVTAAPPSNFDVSGLAIADSMYVVKRESLIDSIIEDLKSINWYSQNPAIERIDALVGHTFNNDSWFVLGRNIYQSACGSSRKALSYLSSLEQKLGLFEESVANFIYAGMLFEVYFDSKGDFRGRRFKTYQFHQIIPLINIARYNKTRVFMEKRLTPYMNTIAAFPHRLNIISVTATVEREEEEGGRRQWWILKELTINERSAFQIIDNRSGHTSREDLRSRIGRTYAVPSTFIDFNTEPPEAAEDSFYTNGNFELKEAKDIF